MLCIMRPSVRSHTESSSRVVSTLSTFSSWCGLANEKRALGVLTNQRPVFMSRDHSSITWPPPGPPGASPWPPRGHSTRLSSSWRGHPGGSQPPSSCHPPRTTWSLANEKRALGVLTNQRTVFRSCDKSGPIRGQYYLVRCRLGSSSRSRECRAGSPPPWCPAPRWAGRAASDQ